jgi:hypothetical protein
VAYKQIEVDDEIYTLLEREARAFVDKTPNDVLRRLLLGEAPEPTPGKPGDLMPLLQDGRLQAGDKLIHNQPRKRRTFTAVVTADGYIQLENGQRFAAPSPALRACTGSQINGWGQWIVERTGKPLQDLRNA